MRGGGEVTVEDSSELDGLTSGQLEDACHEQLDLLCGPPEPTFAMEPETPPQRFDEPPASTSCAVDRHRATPWMLLVLAGIGAVRRRRSGRS